MFDLLVPLFGMLLLFGAIPGIILTGVIMNLKNRRHKVEEHSKLISQMIEKSEGANIDFKAMAEMLNESDTDSKKKTTKMAVLKHLEYAVSVLACCYAFLQFSGSFHQGRRFPLAEGLQSGYLQIRI